MSKPYTGGCACGAIRYGISAQPIAMVDCQCRQCQHQTGAGHGSYLVFSGDAAQIDGEVKSWQAVGDGGTVKNYAFCSACGAPVYIAFPANPGVIALHAGSLDEPGRYKPQFATWHASASGWDHLDPDLPKFDRMPPG